jgi:hypothetical protein
MFDTSERSPRGKDLRRISVLDGKRALVAMAVAAATWLLSPAYALAQPGAGARPPLTSPATPQDRAGPETGPPETKESILGLLLHIGPFSGFGGGVQVGSHDVGLRASVGWTPLLLVLAGGSQSSDLKFYSTLQVSPDLYVAFASPRSTTHLGAQLGYRYSSLLGHGLAGGGYAQFALSRGIDWLLSAGVLIFPDGEDRLRRDQGFSSTAQFSFPSPAVNFGISLGLVFFP